MSRERLYRFGSIIPVAVLVLTVSLGGSYTDLLGMDEIFHDFAKGTHWIFHAEFNRAKREVVIRVKRHEKNWTEIEYDIYNPPDPGATASTDEVWYVRDGYVVWAGYDFERVSPYWHVYRLGAKRGDTWRGPFGRGRATHMGTTDIAVPAGRYRDVVHIRLTDEDEKTHDFYYGPGVGLVKWVTESRFGKSVLELKGFIKGR